MESEHRTAGRAWRPQAGPRGTAKVGDSDEAWRDGVARFVTGLMVVAAFVSILMAVQEIERAFEHNVAPQDSPVAALRPLQDSMAAQSMNARAGERN